MLATHIDAINDTVQKTQIWLKSLEEDGPFDSEAQAYSALRAVLHSFRDRLTVDEAVKFASQLPMLVRGIYFEGWRPPLAPNSWEQSREDFYASIKESLPRNETIDPEHASMAVFRLLKREMSPGLVENAKAQLPGPIKELWAT